MRALSDRFLPEPIEAIAARLSRWLFGTAHWQNVLQGVAVRFVRRPKWTMIILMTALTNPASAQMDQDLKARCSQLIRYYDYYGASRTENSDGGRNMTRIGAQVDCTKGRYQAGIEAMEDLLRRKKFPVPRRSDLLPGDARGW
jgi:hypothetical protein